MRINLFKVNWTRVILVTIILISLCVNFVQCKNNKIANANIEALNSDLSTYELDNGQLVSTSKALEFDKKMLEDLVISKDAELEEMYNKFSKIKSVTKSTTEIIIDSIPVPFEVPVPCDFERSASVIDDDYRFDYVVNQNGLKIKDLLIKDSVFEIVGTKRKWFLGKPTFVIDRMHSNPYIIDTAIDHYEIKEQKKWYQTDAAKVGGAVILIEVLRGLISN